MAGRVILPNGDLSERAYTEFSMAALRRSDRPDWHGRSGQDETVMLSLYQDADSGILVTDVVAFEDWLTEKSLD